MEPKWNITYRPKEVDIVVEEMSPEDIAKFFPEHARAEMTGRFKAIQVEDPDLELVDTVLTRAARS
jgi:hypothetical protein